MTDHLQATGSPRECAAGREILSTSLPNVFNHADDQSLCNHDTNIYGRLLGELAQPMVEAARYAYSMNRITKLEYATICDHASRLSDAPTVRAVGGEDPDVITLLAAASYMEVQWPESRFPVQLRRIASRLSASSLPRSEGEPGECPECRNRIRDRVDHESWCSRANPDRQ